MWRDVPILLERENAEQGMKSDGEYVKFEYFLFQIFAVNFVWE
jgi:hypothetical protein